MQKKRKGIFLFGILLLFVGLYACQNENTNATGFGRTDSSTNHMIAKGGNNVPDEFKEGAKLVNSNDCITCHKVNDTSVGPSFVSIANRYSFSDASVNNLVVSVQKGSTGLWGHQVMIPHPNLTYQDLEKMVRFILSNKKN